MVDPNTPFSLAGKRLLITGAASGIGKATSIVLSNLGAELVLVDVDTAGLSATKELCGSASIVTCDFLNTSSIKDMVYEVAAREGSLNGFVHLAGIPYISPLKSLSETKYLDVLKINTLAALELAKAFVNKKVSRPEGGSIVFISSVYAVVGSAANVGYAMSKAALHGITKSLAIELAPKKIRVNCIAPGFVKTAMMQNTESLFSDDRNKLLEELHPLGLGEAGDVAYACAYLLSDASKWITGTVMNVDGGFTAR